MAALLSALLKRETPTIPTFGRSSLETMSLLSNKLPKRILVTGAGGDIGLGIGRVLKLIGIPYIYGTDLSLDNAGPLIFDGFTRMPRADSTDFVKTLTELARAQKVELVIPTSEAELDVLSSELQDQSIAGAMLLMVSRSIIDISLDKLRTVEFLKAVGLPHPWTLKVKEKPLSVPCIYKPRFGRGSKGVKIIENEEWLSWSGEENAIWQELLLPADEEYTCGVFRSHTGATRSITLRRTLSGGLTGKGEVVNDPQISEYIQTIASLLDLVGSVNIQLRKTDRGPILFEINPRLSSTIVFRHKLGFTDLLWWIEEKYGLSLSAYSAPRAGIRFYRGFTEYFDYKNQTLEH